MNDFNVFGLSLFLHQLSALQCIYTTAELDGSGGTVVSGFKNALRVIDALRGFFESKELPDCVGFCDTAKAGLSRSLVNNSAAAAYLDTFHRSILTALEKRHFLLIRDDLSGYKDQEMLFGKEVWESFPSSRRDIKEAGNCLACERSTACVFHLMRGSEFVLRAVARDRKIDFADKPLEEKEWGHILPKLESEVNDLRSAPRSNWLVDGVKDVQVRFYAEIVNELRSFNDVWRRHVSHADTSAFYDPDQAVSVMDHVQALMQKVAPKISEERVREPIWDSL